MKCNRCQNEDPNLFAYDHRVYYCRKCIDFSRLEVNEKINPVKLKHRTWKGKPKLDSELTASQKCASHEGYQHLSKGNDVILYASTGARQNRNLF